MRPAKTMIMHLLNELDPFSIAEGDPEGTAYYVAAADLAMKLSAQSGQGDILTALQEEGKDAESLPDPEKLQEISAEIDRHIQAGEMFFLSSGLRFGSIVQIYYELLDRKLPKQLDLLDAWFPGRILTEIASDGKTKRDAIYNDTEYRIHAVKYHGSFYSGGSTRISQITGRLCGTANGNQDKERRTAELIRRHLADVLLKDRNAIPQLQENVHARLSVLSEEQLLDLDQCIFEMIDRLVSRREQMDEREKYEEPASMHDEVYEDAVYNIAWQWKRNTFDSLCNAWLWLLLSSLLRDECAVVLHVCDSSFVPVYRKPSETGTLRDKILYLLNPDAYESFYEGDDLDRRFPGIEFYCDVCGDHLNEQEDFDDHRPVWKCTKCGHENRLAWEIVYPNAEYADDHRQPADPEEMEEAVRKRKEEKNGKAPD